MGYARVKIPEARKARLSEGLCPSCNKRLIRVQGEGVCTCCRYGWRLRNSEIEVHVPDDGEWFPDVEGPQGCEEMEGPGWHSYHLRSKLFDWDNRSA